MVPVVFQLRQVKEINDNIICVTMVDILDVALGVIIIITLIIVFCVACYYLGMYDFAPHL
jgi:hypothetical protein